MQIEIFFNRVGKLAAYIFFIVILLELGSWGALKIYRSMNQHVNANAISSEVMAELETVMSNNVFFPTRWYTNMLNFNGKYVVTDGSGFRIDRKLLVNSRSIGFFGGSTMFSVVTRQSETIPDQFKLTGFDSLNFGVGGYSTTAELPTFIEALKKYPNIKVAVFYDGVNESARYVELVQDEASVELFKSVGYYYKALAKTSVLDLKDTNINFKSSFIELWSRLVTKLFSSHVKLENVDWDKVSTVIADEYLTNIEFIQIISAGRGVRTFFFWQPNIFTTKKNLTNFESSIIFEDKTIMPDLARKVREKVISDPRFKKLNIIDLTNALDGSKEEVFYDWCHMNGSGNKIIAKRINSIISNRDHQI